MVLQNLDWVIIFQKMVTSSGLVKLKIGSRIRNMFMNFPTKYGCDLKKLLFVTDKLKKYRF